MMAIWARIAQQGEPEQAERVVARIRQFCNRVTPFPGLVPEHHDPQEGARLVVPRIPYAVWVTEEQGDLVVLRVRHQSQQP